MYRVNPILLQYVPAFYFRRRYVYACVCVYISIYINMYVCMYVYRRRGLTWRRSSISSGQPNIYISIYLYIYL